MREDPSKCTRTLSSSGLTSNGPVAVSAHSRSLMPPGETQVNDIALSNSSNILYSAASNIVRVWDLRMLVLRHDVTLYSEKNLSWVYSFFASLAALKMSAFLLVELTANV